MPCVSSTRPPLRSPYLRRDLLPGLVRQVEQNFRNHVRDVRLFEVGTVFRMRPGQRPEEVRRVAAVVTGARAPARTGRTPAPPDYDRWDLKGLFEAAVALANPEALVQVEGNSWVATSPAGAVVGRATALVADAPPWAAPVFGFELALDVAPRAARAVRAVAHDARFGARPRAASSPTA